MSAEIVYDFRMRVPFQDLDPMQVVWHGNYLKYFDIARFGLFREAGVDLYRYSLEHNVIFPVTKTATKYIVPLRYDDEVVCRAILVEASVKIVIDFEIRRLPDNLRCTTGRGEQVAVKMPEMEMQFEIPADIRRALGAA